MRLAATAVCFFAVAACATAADDSSAPLAGTKEQLKQLRRDQNAQQSGAADSNLKNALPALNTPTPGQSTDMSPPPDPSRQQNAQNKPDAQKNWLLDGFDQLDSKTKKAKANARNSSEDPVREEAGSELLDPSDPNYFLKVYQRQSKTANGADKPEKKTDKGSSPDAFAPFLQGWLAHSPVRDIALGKLAKGDGGANPATRREGSVDALSVDSTHLGQTTGTTASEVQVASPLSTPEHTNPFLQALNLPVSTPVSSPTPSLPVVNNPPPTSTPAAQVPDLIAPPKENPFKAPETKPDQDKKYFPQLKRF